MTETPSHEFHSETPEQEPPVSVKEIIKDNWILARSLIIFILMLGVPLFLAWKLDLFTVANP